MVRRRWLTGMALALSLLLLAGCGGRQSNLLPEDANVEQAAETQGVGDAPAEPAAAAVEGDRYQVVAGESSASYRVGERFLDRNLDAVAVGTTTNLFGELILRDGRLQPSKVTVDLQSLTSDQQRRDQKLKTSALETDKYPTAEFTVTGISGDAPALVEGQEVAVKLEGNMKLHGVEKPWTWDAKIKVEGDTLHLNATTTLNMRDFDIEPPNVLNLISVREQVELEVNIVARKQ